MTAYIKAVMYMKCGHKFGGGGDNGVLISTQAVRKIWELVRKTPRGPTDKEEQ
jgi:hypothetical protein